MLRACQRRVGDDLDASRAAKVGERVLAKKGVELDLVGGGDDASPYSCPTHLEVISVLEGVFDETVATDDGSPRSLLRAGSKPPPPPDEPFGGAAMSLR